MHKTLLCDTSSFFNAALNGKFRESRDQAIEMIEDDAEVFTHFQYWAYTGAIEPKGREQMSWRTLIGIYIFAEARCIPALQNTVMDVLIIRHEDSPRAPIEEYRYLYENTAEKSPARRFIVDWAAHKGSLSKDWFLDRSIYSIDFVIDLSLALFDRINDKSIQDFWEVRSMYHVEENMTFSWM